MAKVLPIRDAKTRRLAMQHWAKLQIVPLARDYIFEHGSVTQSQLVVPALRHLLSLHLPAWADKGDVESVFVKATLEACIVANSKYVKGV